MVKKHLKTLTVPNSWPVKRKESKFTVRPKPGKSFELSIPVVLIFKNMLKYCKTTKELKGILRDKEVFIDGKRCKNPRALVGLMDVLSIPLTEEYYRLVLTKSKRLDLVKISKEEAGFKISKIIGKTILKKGIIQLNLSDSRNIRIKSGKHSVGDSVMIKLPSQDIKESFSLEKGRYAFLIKGSHAGEHGSIEKLSEGADSLITIKTSEGTFDTPRDSVFVIGKDKPSITLD
ncbi:30S ribosomal protein S4e [Candidatus Woesearchaeota archaeon]|nr:30S ribosomal protein S4e [Candidatus Woesearchaeota archaeon]